jgi:hypothetical protein
MTIIPQIVTLGLIAALSSPIPQHQIDFSVPGPTANASISFGS